MNKKLKKTLSSNNSFTPLIRCTPKDGNSLRRQKSLRQNLGLTIKDPACFVLSQWTNNPVPYLIYRTLCAAFFLSMVLYTGIADSKKEKILIFLTYWSFFILTASNILRAVSCAYYTYLGAKKREGKFAGGYWRTVLKIQWVLYYVSTVAAPVVTILYWGLRARGVNYINFTTHATTVIFITLDLLITRTPFRLYHAYITVIYAFIYSMFTAVYWSCGGTDHKQRTYIYKQLDFTNQPAIAVGYLIAISLVATPMAHFFIYIVYRLRLHVFHKTRICVKCGVCPEEIFMDSPLSDSDASKYNLKTVPAPKDRDSKNPPMVSNKDLEAQEEDICLPITV